MLEILSAPDVYRPADSAITLLEKRLQVCVGNEINELVYQPLRLDALPNIAVLFERLRCPLILEGEPLGL